MIYNHTDSAIKSRTKGIKFQTFRGNLALISIENWQPGVSHLSVIISFFSEFSLWICASNHAQNTRHTRAHDNLVPRIYQQQILHRVCDRGIILYVYILARREVLCAQRKSGKEGKKKAAERFIRIRDCEEREEVAAGPTERERPAEL